MPESIGAPDGDGGISIDGIFKQMLGGSPPTQREPPKPTRMDRAISALSYIAEFFAWILLFISFVAMAVTIAGIAGMVSGGSFLGLGLVNSAILAASGGISASAIMSAGTSIRRLAQEARTAPAVKRLMKASGLM